MISSGITRSPMNGSPGMACNKKKVPVTTTQRDASRINNFLKRNGTIGSKLSDRVYYRSMFDRNIDFANKFHFTSLGCARNLVDSEVMIGLLLKNGYEHTPKLEEADYLVVNTCGFLEASRQEGIETIDE